MGDGPLGGYHKNGKKGKWARNSLEGGKISQLCGWWNRIFTGANRCQSTHDCHNLGGGKGEYLKV